MDGPFLFCLNFAKIMMCGGIMHFKIDKDYYEVIIEKKKSNRNTYIRVTKDLKIKVTTNYFTTTHYIEKLLNENYDKIVQMISQQKVKKENNDGFYYLGKKYDIVYLDNKSITFGTNKVFFPKDFDIYSWYKKQAKVLFQEHLDKNYENFTKRIPHPTLRIRKMTTRWGVCNIKTHVITINLELIKRDPKFLDYVIIHELSHLIHGDHSRSFWQLVEENMPDYKKYREEMKGF